MSQRFVKGTMQIGDRTLSSDKNKQEQEYKSDESQETAATMKMYGKLTRKVEEWYPSGLLCKRFNLRNPHTGKKKVDKVENKKSLQSDAEKFLSSMEFPIEEQQQNDESINQNISTTDTIETHSNNNDEEDDSELILTEKPSIDIFKAIFENEEDEEQKEIKLQKTAEQTATLLSPVISEPNVVILSPDAEILSIDPSKIDSIQSPSVEERSITNSNVGADVFTTSTLNAESNLNPYVYYPPKQETRGGPAQQAKVETLKELSTSKDYHEKEQKYDKSSNRKRIPSSSSSSDSSDDDRKRRHKEKKGKEKKTQR